MSLSTLHTYLDVLMQHSLDLMGEADSWPEAAQEHLRAVWTHVDVMLAIAPLPLPVVELTNHTSGLNAQLDTLERFEFSEDAVWHLQVLRDTLGYVSQIIDEHRSNCLAQALVSGPFSQDPTSSARL
jgi:hypothetical protein